MAGLKRNQFYVKATREGEYAAGTYPETTYDTNVSAIFSDLAAGKTSQVEIKGGADALLYLSEHKIPPAPVGNATLVGLKHLFYIPSGGVTQDLENRANPAMFKVWKVNRSMGPNEGNMIPDITSGNTAATSLAVFSSTRSDETVAIQTELFAPGQGTVEGPMGFLGNTSDPYVHINSTLVKLQAGVRYVSKPNMQQLKERHGTNHPDLGWIIYIQPKNLQGRERHILPGPGEELQWEPIKQENQLWGFRFVPEWRDRIIGASGRNLIKWTTPREFTDVEETTYKVTEEDSIFSSIHSHINEETSASPEMKDVVKATATYSTLNSLSGGGSMKMETIWGKDRRLDYMNYTAGGNTSDPATERQEVVCTMELPFPHNIGDTMPAYGGAVNTLSDGTTGPPSNPFTVNNEILPELSTDIYIERLNKTYNVGSNAFTQYMLNGFTFARAFIITFSTIKPKTNQSFFDFCESYPDIGEGEQMFSGISFVKTSEGRPDNVASTPDFSERVSVIDQRKGFGGVHPRIQQEGVLAMPFRTRFIRHTNMDESSTTPPQFGSPEETSLYHRGWSTSKIPYVADNDVDGWEDANSLDLNMVWYNAGYDMSIRQTGQPTEYNSTKKHFRNEHWNLAEGQWNNFRFLFDNDATHIMMQVKESGSDTPYITQRLPVMNLSDNHTHYPKYVTFWLVNFPDKPYEQTLYPVDRASESTDENGETTHSTVYIDNITLRHFNRVVNNATATENNSATRRPIEIKSGTYSKFTCNTDNQNAETIEVKAPTYIAVGFENRSDFDRAVSPAIDSEGNPDSSGGPGILGTNLLFNGYATENPTSNVAIGTSGDTHRYAYLGYTSNESGTLLEVMGNSEMAISESEYYGTFFNPTTKSARSAGKGLFIDGATGADEDTSGINMGSEFGIDSFSQQGFANILFDSSMSGLSSHVPAKRECIWASARMTKVTSNKSFEVDDTTIFNLPDDTEYIIYHKNKGPFNDNWYGYGTFKLAKRPEGNEIFVTEDIRMTDIYRAGGAKEGEFSIGEDTEYADYSKALVDWREDKTTVGKIYISPKKYWMVFMIHPFDSSGNAVADRSYSSICTVNKNNLLSNPAVAEFKDVDRGTTFNEFKYTDGSPLAYWNLTPGNESDLEVNKDYGFGAWDEETFLGGYVNSFYTNDSNTWFGVDLSPLVQVDRLEPEETVTSLYTPANSGEGVSLTFESIQTRSKATDQKDKGFSGMDNQTAKYLRPLAPRYLAIYEDEPPRVADFSVRPSEVNPSFPTFNWQLEDADSWYGFIIIDDDEVRHQYHKAGLHVPCNTPATSNDNPNTFFGQSKSDRDEWFNYNAGTSGKFLENNRTVVDENLFLQPNGIAGWAYDFKMSRETEGDYLTIPYTETTVDSNDVETEYINVTNPTTNMSFIAHITPRSAEKVDEWGHLFSAKYPPIGYEGETNLTHKVEYDAGGNPYLVEDKDTVFSSGGSEVTFETIRKEKTVTNPFTGKEYTIYWYEVDKNTIASDPRGITVSLNRRTQRIEVVAHPVDAANSCILTSSSLIPMDDVTPTCIIVTLDTTIPNGNLKLFINGKLEDMTGNATSTGSINNWKKGEELDIDVTGKGGTGFWVDDTDSTTDYLIDEIAIGAVCKGYNKHNNTFPYTGRFCGKIEELVYYPITIYPVDPTRENIL